MIPSCPLPCRGCSPAPGTHDSPALAPLAWPALVCAPSVVVPRSWWPSGPTWLCTAPQGPSMGTQVLQAPYPMPDPLQTRQEPPPPPPSSSSCSTAGLMGGEETHPPPPPPQPHSCLLPSLGTLIRGPRAPHCSVVPPTGWPCPWLTHPRLNPKTPRGQGPPQDPSTPPAASPAPRTPGSGPLGACSPLPHVFMSLPIPTTVSRDTGPATGKDAAEGRMDPGSLQGMAPDPMGTAAPRASITPRAIPAHGAPAAALLLHGGHEATKAPGSPLRLAARGTAGESGAAELYLCHTRREIKGIYKLYDFS